MNKLQLLSVLKKNQISEENIFEFYLGFKVVLGKKYKNPFREDKKEGCFFCFIPNGKLIFIDWSYRRYDIFDIVKHKYNVSFSKSMLIIQNDFNISKNDVEKDYYKKDYKEKITINSSYKIKIKKRNFNKQELSYWNLNLFNFTTEYLESFKIYCADCYFEYKENDLINFKDDLRFHFCYYSETKKIQLYIPFHKKGQRKFINDSKLIYNCFNSLNKNESYVVITKSRKDCFYMQQFGINCFYILNEKIILPIEIIEYLNKDYRQVFTFFDNDRTGKRTSIIYKNKFKTIPLFSLVGKDFTEMLSNIGMDMIDVIEHYKKILLNE